ncbi:dimethylguanosine trna methyltransferase [Diaporthe amygdali]|uniref:dimethylguanosine trna methyltransferase n=1 Tax=Phomopsis amygdali TaxID=1214568 RepID=UPI0022FE2281|nr:dimethylguanosine trna methyltransferase [Diaporthe amygdali]KAJ0118128.1 dimethylguanosine trna methyltransferase [Diaporthe amygdali]
MASQPGSIRDAPAAGQIIDHNGKRYITIQEGGAYILVPETAKDAADQKDPRDKDGPAQSVFYNPIQQFNRDLTILAIKAHGEEMVEKKKASMEAKRQLYAGKKRKRNETKNAGGSSKAAKVDGAPSTDNSTAPAASDADLDAQGEIQVTPNKAQSATKEVQPATEQATNGNGSDPQQGQDTPMEDAPVEGQSEQANEAANGQNAQRDRQDRKPYFTILDALSATGLRALRYAQEMPFVTKITANDLDASAVESIKLNVLHNGLDDKIDVNHGDAIVHMYSKIAAHQALTEKDKAKGKSEKYDVVDLDPYGTAAMFLDAAVQAVRDDGGLLCVTCTDAGVWASNGYPEKAFALYGGVPVKGHFSHEVGLRLILHAISTSAARYGLSIEPLLSLSIDFYARVFVRVSRSPAAVKFTAGKTMIVYNCDVGCGAWSTQFLLRNKAHQNKNGSGFFYKHTMAQGPTADQHCAHCGTKMHLAGPMFGGRLHSPDFVKRILDKLPEASKETYGTTERIKGMLTTALEEHLDDAETEGKPKSKDDALAEIEPYPFFFLPTALARTIHCATPPEDAIRGALRGLGYRVTRSHCKPGSIKTDAPWSVLWDVMREWVRQKAPVKEANIKSGSPGYRLLGLGAKESADAKVDGPAPDSAGKEDATGEKKASVEEEQKIVFDEKLGREKSKERLVRYQANPRENWGPMNRAKGQ